MLTTVLQAQNTTCDTVTSLPWSEGFDNGIACWTVPSGSNWMFFDPSGGGALLNKYIQSNSQPVGTDNWIISRPIALPLVDSMNLVLEWSDANYNDVDHPYHYSVLVTTSTNPLAASAVWDTLYHVDGDTLVYNSSQSIFTRRQAELTAYAGQTIYIAFRHQPIVNAPGSYGLMRLCIDNVTVREMHPCEARAVPWSEDFASDNTRECWPDLIYYDYMGIPAARVWHHLLVSPAFSKPDSVQDLQLRWTKQYSSVSGSRTMVLVSPTGGLDEADFTDTLYNVVNPNLGNASDSVLLGQAYAGQTIRVAFGVSSGYLVLSNVAVNNSTAAPSVSLMAPSLVRTGDSVSFVASPGNCAQSGLSFSWHSTLTGLSSTTAGEWALVYTSGGIDTVIVVVTNSYGTDSAMAVVQVVDCTPQALPYYENFESVPATASNVGGHLPMCWYYSLNGSSDAIAPHVISPGGYQYISGIPSKALYMESGYTLEGIVDHSDVILLPLADSLKNLSIAFDYRFEYVERGTLQVGYYDDTVFTTVQTMIPHDGSYRRDTVSFANITTTGGFIALRWSYGSNYYYYAVIIDNIEVFQNSPAVIDTIPEVPDTVWRSVTVACDTTMGNVIGGGTYLDSSLVTLIAIAFEGYHFVEWNDLDTHAVRQILVTSDTILSALFAQDTLPILDTVWHIVTITSNEAGACETYGSGQYMDGDTVEIGYHMLDTASGGGHWQFLGWNDGATENSRNIVVTSDTSIIALFEWVADSTESIGDILSSNIKVYSLGGRIVVEDADGEEVRVYDIMGRELIKCDIRNSCFEIHHSKITTGVYLVKVGNRSARKVVVIR